MVEQMPMQRVMAMSTTMQGMQKPLLSSWWYMAVLNSVSYSAQRWYYNFVYSCLSVVKAYCRVFLWMVAPDPDSILTLFLRLADWFTSR
mmetsp:Transcript_13066/g.23705  ORF Transcript_13066/g.23705 Transcript_13066/m.23705 type:complete len:89 (-) Transcript_13066:123-389(-)